MKSHFVKKPYHLLISSYNRDAEKQKNKQEFAYKVSGEHSCQQQYLSRTRS